MANVRFSTFNASLNRGFNAANPATGTGQLAIDLSTPNNAQAKNVAETIQRVNPDILLINEFDFDPAAVNLFKTNYLAIGQNGATPITDYNFTYIAPSNTGVSSGFDLNNNGVTVTTPGAAGYGDDSFGFGVFEGQFGMLLLSRYAIDTANIRTFQTFKWKDMPDNLLTNDPTPAGPNNLGTFYNAAEQDALRLSSKSHWDVPIDVGGGEIVHVLASHPTPPVFDGPEDRNGKRNHDEIKFWADYINTDKEVSAYIYDDAGGTGGLTPGASFVIMGDQNADPFDGDSYNFAIRQLLNNPEVNTGLTIPTSLGGVEQNTIDANNNLTQKGNPIFDTADFGDTGTSPGNLRVDYVLPSKDLGITNASVFWPLTTDPLFSLVGGRQSFATTPTSDHSLVWADVNVGVNSLRPTVRTVSYLGQAVFPTASVSVAGTQVGGLSGITYDAANNRFYSISDDRSSINPARFYTLTVDLSSGKLNQAGVNFTGVTTLKDAANNPFAPNTIDPEGIALTNTGTVFISSEGQVSGTIASLQSPFVNEFNLTTGQQVRALPVPTKFVPVVVDGNGNGTIDAGEQTAGIRNNLAFEIITVTPDQKFLFTASENALVQDGGTATTAAGSRSRILKYNLTTGQPEQEFLYNTDSVSLPPNPGTGFNTNGLVELLALDSRGTLLALERSFSVGVPGTGNTIKLYEIQLEGASDISGINSLNALSPTDLAALKPVQKRLLVNFDNLGITTGLDNVEGMTLGPILPNGQQSLILTSDNNFSPTQFTQVLALGLTLTSATPGTAEGATPNALPTVETVDVLDTATPPLGRIRGDVDDPAIYVHPTNPLVIGALKDGGLIAYNMAGGVVQTIAPANYGDVRYNNVDLVRGFTLSGAPVDLAIASDRKNDTLAIFKIDATNPTTPLTDVTSATLSAAAYSIFGVDNGSKTAYGLAGYRSAITGKSYVFVTQRTENKIAQLELVDAGGGKVGATLVRTLTAPAPASGSAQFEGLVVDKDTGYLYAGQEDVGIWKFGAEPTAGTTGVLIHALGANSPSIRKPDVEGLTIYYGPNGTGYLLASNQGENTFAVFTREGNNEYLGSFAVGANTALGIDSDEESDGADVVSVSVGPFTQGLLVVQDGNNDPAFLDNDGGEISNISGNFKYIPWENVAATFAKPSTLPNGVASGDTTQNSTVLWTRSTAPGAVTFQYSTSANFATIAGTRTGTVTDITLPVKVDVTGLNPNTTYYYRATDASGASATGQFRTAAALGTKAGLRFGVAGDWRGELAPYPAISNADTRNLAFFVQHGDTIYADYPSPAVPLAQAKTLSEYRAKHAEVYGNRNGINTWGDLRASTSIFATIDDHEVTNDFSGGVNLAGATAAIQSLYGATSGLVNDSPLFDTGLQTFQEYNPLRDDFYGATGDTRTAGERKLYRYQTYGSDAAIAVLDNRSFRDAPLPSVTNPANATQVSTFLANSFNPSRTLLGRVQVDDLKRDLLDAETKGITWKFVMVPEPIQNLGVLFASDRYEGYAAERTEILKFIKDNGIDNVVFVSADIHGTVVNNLTYQESPTGAQIGTNAFDISTGAVAFDAPFGPTVANIAAASGLLSPALLAAYNSLPINNDTDSTVNDKDDFVKDLINQQLTPLGYDRVGLNDNLAAANGLINATLLQGDYVATHTYGWSEFNIDPVTQELKVTTYGVAPYTEAEILANPGLSDRTPKIVSEFTVRPGSTPGTGLLSKNASDLFFIGNSVNNKVDLQFTLNQSGTNLVNEIGVFAVDNDLGTINGIAPGQTGYLQAALNKGQSIFSVLADGFGGASTRQLGFKSGDRLVFYVVQNSTSGAVLNDLAAGKGSANIFFAATFNSSVFKQVQVTETSKGVFKLAWEDALGGGDRDFDDLVLTIQATTATAPKGAGLQGKEERELIDLRGLTGSQTATFTVNSEASFTNFAGLYTIDDLNGTVNGIAPGQAGYAQAALGRRVVDVARDSNFTTSLAGGALLAPFLIANGSVSDFLARNPSNQGGQRPIAYFAYSGANPDRIDHVRLLGDNKFGFEDLPGGGDLDFNDIVMQVKFA